MGNKGARTAFISFANKKVIVQGTSFYTSYTFYSRLKKKRMLSFQDETFL